MNNRLKTILFPVILALAIVLGMFINSVMNRQRMPLHDGIGVEFNLFLDRGIVGITVITVHDENRAFF